MKVAVTLEQCWHRVPGGTAASVLGMLDGFASLDGDPDRPEPPELIGVSARHAEAAPAPWTPGIAVEQLPLPRPLLYEAWHAPLRVWPSVERATGPVDVVHATAVAYPITRAPVVVTIHDLAFLHDDRRATRHGHRFFRRGTELARRHAALVVVPSRATFDECIAAGFHADRVRIVPWGIHPSVTSDEEVTKARAAHGLDRPYVLFTGTVEPRKNLPRLLAAFRSLHRDDVDLVLIGPEGWNEDVGDALRDLGPRAHALGFLSVDERNALMAGAAVFCYPSISEGFGLPVLEAMAQGAPVVTSSTTSTHEVVGDAGLTVDPADTDAIAAAIAQLLDDRDAAAALGRAARERAATFTWERTATGYLAAYREALH
jgi:glycosyltransferase involved in cell wall biosynthesis